VGGYIYFGKTFAWKELIFIYTKYTRLYNIAMATKVKAANLSDWREGN